jgi:hypothetical protein
MLLEKFTFTDEVMALRRAVHSRLGWAYSSPAGPPAAFVPMNSYGMVVTRGNGFYFRGAVEGVAYGAQKFTLTDVTAHRLEPKKYDEGPIRAGFEGVIISLSHPSAFKGRTIIRRDLRVVNPRRVDGMKRVGLVDPTFERVFEVFSDDQVEARDLITPDFKERLLAFNDAFLGRGVQLAFLGGRVHIALDIDERFNFNKDVPAYDFRDASGVILHEIGSIFTLLEDVQTLQSRIGRKGAAGADKARHGYYTELMQLLIKEVKAMEGDFKKPSRLQEDLRDTHYMFCDSLKGLLSPRF